MYVQCVDVHVVHTDRLRVGLATGVEIIRGFLNVQFFSNLT